MFPTKKQWKDWSLPSRVSYLGFVLGIVGVATSVAFYLWPRDPDSIADQPQLSVNFTTKPYLRYSLVPDSGLKFSYEICFKNSGKHPAKNLEYSKVMQTLQIEPDFSVVADSLPSNHAPSRLVSGENYCQIFNIQNPKLNPDQIAKFIQRYDADEVAILLDLGLRYVDEFTGKEFVLEERNKVKKDRVEIHRERSLTLTCSLDEV